MSKKNGRPRIARPLVVRKPVSKLGAELLREFEGHLNQMARDLNAHATNLANSFARRIADLDGVKLTEGWKLDQQTKEWVRPK